MAELEKNIRYIKGVGAVKARDLKRLGIKTLKDALLDAPFRYEDLSKHEDIAHVEPGQKVTVRGTISVINNRRSKKRRKMMITEAVVEDPSGTITAVWFHQGFLTKILKPGTVVSLSGKVDDRYGLSLVNPVYEVIKGESSTKHTGRIVPIYRLAGALTQKNRRAVTEAALKHVEEMDEWIPHNILKKERLPDIHTMLKEVHFPNSEKAKDRAILRLKFEEFFLHQLLHAQVRQNLAKQPAPAIPFQQKAVKEIIDSLPFTLTDGQKKALWAIIQDMEKASPMNRLLEGDVGTGKTVVAALAGFNAAQDGWQTAMLAPTEILSDQHAQTLEELLGGHMNIAVFTRTKRRVNKKEVTKDQMLSALRNGKIDLVVGTHALLGENVLFNRLGLIVVDEQHRFGVNQRRELKDREGDKDGVPHLLSMTATPIPRSLALVLYGDLDVSLLKEYPAGRKPIETFLVEKGREKTFYKRMRDEMEAGRQVFVVSPLIEESDALGVKSVTEVYKSFKKGPFKDFNIAKLHGKLKTEEKDGVMKRFSNGELDMVIATTVVEVGVDIPNATVMFIEGAERFGLAQLHQLRGRVGRSDQQSYCFLHPTDKLSNLARERLKAVVNSQNGFELADKDLKLRGPGNIFGTDQSGFEQFKYGTYADVDIIAAAREYAQNHLERDSDLDTWPALKKKLREYIEAVHFE